MERRHTLRTIADSVDRDKRTVQTWFKKASETHGSNLGELNDGVRYFSDDERKMLLQYMGEKPVAQPSPPAPPQITVEVGNHQIVLPTPQLPTAFSLESLRTSEAVTIDDPLGAAAQFLQLADQLADAMQADIRVRQQRLKQTKAAKDAISQKAQVLQLERRLYQLQTAQIDDDQSQEAADLIDQLATLDGLGKPAEPA